MKNSVLCSLGITEQDYDYSLNKLIKEPTATNMIEKMELEIKEKYEPVLPLKSRDEVKEIYCKFLECDA